MLRLAQLRERPLPPRLLLRLLMFIKLLPLRLKGPDALDLIELAFVGVRGLASRPGVPLSSPFMWFMRVGTDDT